MCTGSFPAPALAPLSRTVTRRVLIFDDDLYTRQAWLQAPLAHLVYRPHADRAVADVREVEPDLVLMDYAMGPHLDGARAVAELRRHFGSAELTIVGISSDPRCNQTMIRAGADAGVPKALLPEALGELLSGPRLAPR